MRPRKPIALLLIAVVCFWTAARCHDGLNSMRAKYQLVPVEPLENAPPEVAFSTVALGAFSGLIADFLWMRAMRLQEEAKYFEAVQLADWITKLQPRFTMVWLFQAWNMAYNISVEFPDFHDRWLWVQRGIELIRDKGLFYNPADPDMYRELAWIFLDKMGGLNDDANMYYKRQWALEMTDVFAGERPQYDELIHGPQTLEELRRDPAMAAFLDRVREAGFDLAEDYYKAKLGYIDMPPAARKIVEDPANQSLMKRFDLYARIQRLKKHYRLDPAEMQRLDREYGTLEWRLPEAHAVYWTVQGIQRAPDKKAINNDRILLHAVEANFERGRLIMTEDGPLLTTPNPNIIPKLHKYLDYLEAKYDDPTLKPAHASFLREAIRILYMFNRRAEAQKYFLILRERSPGYRSVPSVDDFVLQETIEKHETRGRKEILNEVIGALYQSYWFLAAGDLDQAKGLEGFAKLVWVNYQQRTVERRALPPFESIRKQTLQRCLKEFPEVLANRLRLQLQGG